jgi:hypothetical protein
LRSRKRRLALRGVLLGVACVVGSASLWTMIGPVVRSRRVERAIALFERKPSQAGADELVGLLRDHAATAEQGERILVMLLRPVVRTRPTYAAGKPVSLALERPFRLDFQGVLWQLDQIGIDGRLQFADSGRRGAVKRTLHVQGLDSQRAKPGVHQLDPQCTYKLGLERHSFSAKLAKHLRRVPLASWLPLPAGWQPARTYECRFAIPVTVTVAREAEMVELVSSPELDEAMRVAFGLGASGSASSRSAMGLDYRNLPMDVAFRTTLRLTDENGLAMPVFYSWQSQHGRWRGRAGGSGRLSLDHWWRWIQTGTTYRGTLTLEPDPEYAYEDPTIKAIWGGTLEIPISYDASSGFVTISPSNAGSD